MKRILPFIFVLVISTSIVGCAKSNKLPELTVIIDQKKVNVIIISELANNTKSIFKPAFKKEAATEIRYVKIGEKVTLDFAYNPPDKMTIQEIFLNTNGENLYSDATIKEITFTQEKNKYFFTVEKSFVSALNSMHNEGKRDFRGYNIATSYSNNKKIYAFVIKTDPY